MLSHGNGVEANKQVYEISPTVSFSDYHEFEDMFNPIINHEDDHYFHQNSLEILEDTESILQQPSVLQKDEIGSNHKTENMQRQFNFQSEQGKEVLIEIFCLDFYDLWLFIWNQDGVMNF
jgi:hypothetical protein